MQKPGGMFRIAGASRAIGVAIGAALVVAVATATLVTAKAKVTYVSFVEASAPSTTDARSPSIAPLGSATLQPELFNVLTLLNEQNQELKTAPFAASSKRLALVPFPFSLNNGSSPANGGSKAPSRPNSASLALVLFIGGLAGLAFLTRGGRRKASSPALHSTAEL